MRTQDYTVIDLETTGLDPKKERIIQVGAVKVRQDQIVDRLDILIAPGKKLEERITELTGIREQDLEGKPYIEEVLSEILEFLGQDILIGHRILFDYSFLKKVCTNQKIPFERKGIDTLKLARRYLPPEEKKNLPNLCKRYAIEYTPHRALEDALATHTLYQKLRADFFEEETFAPKPLLFKFKKESPITKAQKERLLETLQRHGMESQYDIATMTKNEASRYLDQIAATFGR